MKFVYLFVCLLIASCGLNQQKKVDNFNAPLELDESFIKENVFIKNKTEEFITYSYKNVRVDEVAKLASRYCGEANLRAYLRDVVLDKDNYRLATFDCIVVNY
ncbi:MAG: hypothetical protein R3Y43_00420 [Alphaproteobacteria bacterium]